ncbi:MAG: C39 family peptidase [Anaerolineae bacterium]
MSRLESPIHIQQDRIGYCLPACGQMALAQLGIEVTQMQLAQILDTRVGIGTPFSRVERLAQWPVRVSVTEWGTMDTVAAALAAETAVIAAITTTSGLPGWAKIRTQHTVLVVHVNSDQVTYHDPALAQGPVSVLRDEFLLAWSYMAEKAAFLTRT